MCLKGIMHANETVGEHVAKETVESGGGEEGERGEEGKERSSEGNLPGVPPLNSWMGTTTFEDVESLVNWREGREWG